MQRATAVLFVLAAAAGAEAQEIRGPYVGLSAGYFSYDEGGDNLGVPVSDETAAYRVLGGYQINSVYAVELSLGKTSTFEDGFFAFDPGSGGELSLRISGEYEITTLRFVALAPFSRVNMFGGVGYYDSTLDSSFRFQSPVEVVTGTDRDEDDGLTVAGGIQYEFDRIALRGEYEWFDVDDGVDLQGLSATAIFRF